MAPERVHHRVSRRHTILLSSMALIPVNFWDTLALDPTISATARASHHAKSFTGLAVEHTLHGASFALTCSALNNEFIVHNSFCPEQKTPEPASMRQLWSRTGVSLLFVLLLAEAENQLDAVRWRKCKLTGQILCNRCGLHVSHISPIGLPRRD